LPRVRKPIKSIIDVIKEGMRTPDMKKKLETLEAEREKVEREAAAFSVPGEKIIDFHPGLPALYRRKIAEIQMALKDEALRREAMMILRTLIEKVVVTPTETGVEVAVPSLLGRVSVKRFPALPSIWR